MLKISFMSTVKFYLLEQVASEIFVCLLDEACNSNFWIWVWSEDLQTYEFQLTYILRF